MNRNSVEVQMKNIFLAGLRGYKTAADGIKLDMCEVSIMITFGFALPFK